MRRLDSSYGFSDPAPYAQVGWPSLGQAHARYAHFVPHYRRGMRVLDVGCGNGLFYDWLIENGYAPDYWGLEGSDEFIRQFVERRPEVKSRLIRGNVTRPEATLPLTRGAPKEFDVATVYGVAADLGTGNTPKMHDLGAVVRNAMPLLREGGVLVMDFWDEARFKATPAEVLSPEMLLNPSTAQELVPPAAWDPDAVSEFFEGGGLRFEMHPRVVGRDFGIVAYKDGARRADEQSSSAMVVFDFADALLADARRLSAATVEKAVEGVVGVLRKGAADVRRSSRWQDRDTSFAGQIVAALDSAASQLERQWRTTARSVGLGEGIAWRFGETLPADVKDFGQDRVRKSVDAVSAVLNNAVDDIARAARGMSFPVDSGLIDSLDGANSVLRGEWQKAQQEVWAA